MNEYCRGFEDALDLVQYRIQSRKLFFGNVKNEIQKLVDRVKESKIVKLERELDIGE